MNKTTYIPCFKKKYSTDDFGTIQIRITTNRKSKYETLGEKIKEKYWNPEKKEVRKNHPEQERLNTLLETTIKELKQINNVPDDEIILVEKVSFFRFFKEQLEYLLTRKRLGSYKSQKTGYYHLSNYLSSKGKTDLLFEEINPILIRDFETYLKSKEILNNSCIKYIKTFKSVYNEGVKLGKYQQVSDPFILVKNKYSPVEKKTLKRIDIEKIFKTTFKEKDPLYNVKNYFLFQIFAQGMRVSDLLTLRWSNVKDAEINFYQLKTKSQHRIPFNDIIILKIADYIPNRGLEIINLKFDFNILGEDFSLNFKEIEEKYESVRKGNIHKVIEGDEKVIRKLENWIEVLNKSKDVMIKRLAIRIVEYSKSNLKKFIFPILDDEVFKDVDFTSEKYTLSKYQFNQMSSKTTVYNKYLKKLQEKCEIDVVLTSHLARHSYTSLMIESTDKDIYTISKSLGHANISTTQHYISEFLDERVHKENDKLNKTFKNIF